MKRLLSVLGILLLISGINTSVNAESKKEAKIKFKETVYDFGTIKEEGGPVTHEFKFTNDGEGNLVIQSARAECGCTKPEYPKNPVTPGKSGTIKVTYNPAGRPGGFTKVVTVRCSGNPGKVVLKIRGTVVPSQKSLSLRYPIQKGDLLMETNRIKAGELETGQTRHSFVGIYNNGSDTLRPVFDTGSKSLLVNVSPSILAPGEMATITFYLNSARLKTTGLQEFQVKGKWGDGVSDTVTLHYDAIVLPKTT